MDPPDSTETKMNLSFDSEIFGPRPDMQCDINDDIFQELFCNMSDEIKESCVGDQLEVKYNGDVEYDHIMKPDPEPPNLDEDLKPPELTIGKVSAMIEKLKLQNRELKEKTSKQEDQLSKYEDQLSEKMHDLFQMQMERDTLKESLRVANDEREALQMKLEEKEAELKQFKGLIQKQIDEEEELQTLKRQMSNETKLFKKTERDLQRNTELLNKTKHSLRFLRKRNKKLVTVFLEFGEIIEHKELLSQKHKKYLNFVRKKFQEGIENSDGKTENSDELYDSDTSVEDNAKKDCSVVQMGDNLNKANLPIFNGLIIKKEENSVYSNGIAVDSYVNSETYTTGFLHEIKSSPRSALDEENFVNTKSHTYVPSPLAKENDAVPLSQVTCKSEETSNDQEVSIDKTGHPSPDSNFLFCASGTESLCSEDLDITDECFAEVKKVIKGWEVESAPISPLPPSPSPKCNTEVGSSILQSESDIIENSDVTLSLVSTSPDPSTLKRESERNVGSKQFIPFSHVSDLDQQVSPTSPEPSPECTEKKRDLSQQNSSILERESKKVESSDQFIPFSQESNQSDMPVPSESSSGCNKKSVLLHQNSNGFEPHTEENYNLNPVLNNSTAVASCISPPRIPPNLHYLSSTYSEDNTFRICHQGGSVYDYLVNPENNFSVCVLTINPKKTSLRNQTGSNFTSSGAKNVCIFPGKEERMSRVLSLYHAAENRLNLLSNQILNSDSSQKCTNNSMNENFPHIYVVMENKNDLTINAIENVCAPENIDDSGMDLEDSAYGDNLKDKCISLSTEQRIDDNQSFVSSSCDVSTPSKRKLTSSSFKYQSDTLNKLPDQKDGGKSCKLKGELHDKGETEPNISKVTNKKKRVTIDMEESPCKKLKSKRQIPNVSERNRFGDLHSDKKSDLSVTTSQLKLKNSSSKNQTPSNVYSPQLKLQNSPSKNQPLSSINDPQLEFQISPSKNQPLSSINDPQSEFQISPSKNQPLSINNTQIKLHNSPSKNLTLSNINNPQLELQNSPSKNQLLCSVTSPQWELENSSFKNQPSSNVCNLHLGLKNSPSKEQSLSDINNSHLELNNSPLKEQSSSNINSSHLELKNSPSKEQSSNINNSHLELKNSPSKEQSSNINNSQLEIQNSPSKTQLLSNICSPQLKPQNSSSNNQLLSPIGSPQLELKNSLPKSPSFSSPAMSFDSSHLELKNSPSKEQSSNINNSHLELQNSPSKTQLSNVCSPQLKPKNSSSNNQLLSPIGSPQLEPKSQYASFSSPAMPFDSSHLELKNSPSKEQSSNINNSNLELQNSPSKTQLLSDVCSPQLKPKNSSSNDQLLSPIGSPQLELKNSLPKSQYVSFSSPAMSFDENSLIIDEDIGEESDLQETNAVYLGREEASSPVDNAFECSSSVTGVNQTSDNVQKKSKNRKKKRNKAPAKMKQKKPKLSNEEESINIVLSIDKVLEQIEAVKIQDSLNESHFKRYAHTLFSAIINPSNACSTTSVLFQIFNHLTHSRTNPLMSFPIEYNASVFFPLTERCIVSAIIQAERKKKSHLKGLIPAAIDNLYSLVLSKETITKTGLGAFCRVFTELCKVSTNRTKPIFLSCELIKTRHKFAPILIACIMGVWPELFSISADIPGEEGILQSSIAYSLSRKPQYSSLTSADWKQCKAVFSKYLKASPTSNIEETAKNITEILEEFLEETPCENDYLMTYPLLIFAACKDWDWVHENLNDFILPSLARYAQQKESERAFSLFCNLYADISLLSPKFEECSDILEQLFHLKKEAFDYVKGCAARSLMKLYLLSKHKFPSYLYEWTKKNQSKLTGTPTEILLKQRLMSASEFSEDDIIDR